MKRFLIFLCLTLSIFYFFTTTSTKVKADKLSETIYEQLENLDLTKIEELFNENIGDFRDTLMNLISGKIENNSVDIFSQIKDIILLEAKNNLPLILTITAICLLLSIVNSIKDNFSEGMLKTINLVGLSVILILFSGKIVFLIKDSYQIINKISKINEIISPLLLTLMLTSGATISAGIYSPTSILISSFINNIVSKIFFPILIIILVLTFLSYFSEFNLNGYKEFLQTFIKWFLGLFAILFTILLSIQGITGGIRDGISIKATRYILSSSLPIIGGIVGGGFDFVLCGGVIIKNSIGIIALILIFFIVLKPILNMIIFSFFLKAISVISEGFLETSISSFTKSLSSFLNYLIAIIVISALTLIIYIFLIIVSAYAHV